MAAPWSKIYEVAKFTSMPPVTTDLGLLMGITQENGTIRHSKRTNPLTDSAVSLLDSGRSASIKYSSPVTYGATRIDTDDC